MIKRFENLVEHPATGFTVPEALARKIDELSRGLPKDFAYRRLARKSDEFTLDAGERTDVSFITTDDLDRDAKLSSPPAETGPPTTASSPSHIVTTSFPSAPTGGSARAATDWSPRPITPTAPKTGPPHRGSPRPSSI